APPEPAGRSWASRAVGYGGIGVGSALLGTALYFGYRVKLDRDEARERCPASPCGDAEGVRRNEAARDAATAANVSAVLGLAALGVGLYVTLRPAPAGPRAAPRASLASLALAPGFGRVNLVGSFE
ncbi:MAG TPA: hypothetical protein VFS00_08735, partial [Polyangiaceae bacterium]|nr:hypothetical protein [Polyangiaceae bacterium]